MKTPIFPAFLQEFAVRVGCERGGCKWRETSPSLQSGGLRISPSFCEAQSSGDDQYGRLPEQAAELVRQRVALIFAGGRAGPALAAKAVIEQDLPCCDRLLRRRMTRCSHARFRISALLPPFQRSQFSFG